MSIFGHVITDMKKAGTLLRNATAFVPQELSFFPMQTPEEAVRFVACLVHGRNAADVVNIQICIRGPLVANWLGV
jgi:ABC-type multidrug transport system ATPase subunit